MLLRLAQMERRPACQSTLVSNKLAFVPEKGPNPYRHCKYTVVALENSRSLTALGLDGFIHMVGRRTVSAVPIF
jgi:hypothetical protein